MFECDLSGGKPQVLAEAKIEAAPKEQTTSLTLNKDKEAETTKTKKASFCGLSCTGAKAEKPEKKPKDEKPEKKAKAEKTEKVPKAIKEDAKKKGKKDKKEEATAQPASAPDAKKAENKEVGVLNNKFGNNANLRCLILNFSINININIRIKKNINILKHFWELKKMILVKFWL